MKAHNEKCWLLVNLLETNGSITKVKGNLFDGTEFSIFVPSGLVDPVETNPKQAWLQVIFNGEANKRSAVTLPAPILDKGHEISVNSNRLNFNKKV